MADTRNKAAGMCTSRRAFQNRFILGPFLSQPVMSATLYGSMYRTYAVGTFGLILRCYEHVRALLRSMDCNSIHYVAQKLGEQLIQWDFRNPAQTMVLIDQNASQQCEFSHQNLCCAPRSVEMRRPSEPLWMYIFAMIYEPASTPISPVWRQRVTESCTIEKQIHFLH